jgi:Carbohydrate-binding module 48 (Isoamylase N-terminal domain)
MVATMRKLRAGCIAIGALGAPIAALVLAIGCGGGPARAVSGPGDASAGGATSSGDGGPKTPDDAASSSLDADAPPFDASTSAMGATALDGGGVEFRVWAPSADGVSVQGDFAGKPIHLAEDDSGVFSAIVASAQVGQSYSYLVESGGKSLERLDPYARDLNGNEAVIVDPRTYPWKSPAFVMPPKNESVV